jgi:hypothetical protein
LRWSFAVLVGGRGFVFEFRSTDIGRIDDVIFATIDNRQMRVNGCVTRKQQSMRCGSLIPSRTRVRVVVTHSTRRNTTQLCLLALFAFGFDHAFEF